MTVEIRFNKHHVGVNSRSVTVRKLDIFKSILSLLLE